MPQVNLYYKSVVKRSVDMKAGLMSFLLVISSWPRMLLEVFLRRNMGERYFSFTTSLFLAVILTILPLFMLERSSRLIGASEGITFLTMYLTWYIYVAAFVYMAWQRRKEIKRLPSVFDFGRYSLSTGELHQAILNFHLKGKPADIRTIETVIEPGVVAVIGFQLWFAAQPIGLVLLISSLFYALSYRAGYWLGDQFIIEKIDITIFNEELAASFVEGLDASQTRGINYRGRKPADPDLRRQLAESFVREEAVEAM